MTASEHSWQRWSELRVGDPSQQVTYWQRLAKRQGWTVDFAEHVFREYRKFLFLVLTSPEPVTPPPPIRAAWNLHREFPSWRALPEAEEIERRLARPGTVEQTRAAYIAAFDTHPPESIWPIQFRRAPEPKQRGSRLALALFVAVVMGLVWGDVIPGPWITLVLAATVGVIIACFQRWNQGQQPRRRHENPSADAGSCESAETWSPDEIYVNDADDSCDAGGGSDCSDGGDGG